ncbi:DUF167 domain-containing protein [Terriglobus sp. TAA 43]|uniref:DUF167 domain-containing protein n=1 Tax=Terriglobus sp. TAA 43 TaxID=278961 RepID=UPI000647D420|nr:DUF167 domain-containing protein [Terriglobus sp. TAA 43]
MNIRDIDGGVSFAIRVQPGASREGVVGLYGEAIKIALNAPAVDGKANEALIRYLATALNVPKTSINIAAGLTSRSKVIHVLGVTNEEAAAKLSPAAAV